MGTIPSGEAEKALTLIPLEAAGLTLFILALAAGIFATVFSLPGTVLILVASFLYALFTGFEPIGFRVLAVLAILSVAAEAGEFVLGMLGAARFGASRKAFWVSLGGGLLGAFLLAPLLFGAGALLGMFVGSFAGMLAAEVLRQRQIKPALRAAWGALLGTAAGILFKGLCALAMTVIVLMKIYS